MRLLPTLSILLLLLTQSCTQSYSLGNRAPTAQCFSPLQTRSNIKHVVILIPENHSFDNYFANYCKAAPFSNPSCNEGPECCETAPTMVDGFSPLLLDDAQNIAFDPNHFFNCELEQVNGGLMDRFLTGNPIPMCSDPRNLAYADEQTMATYWDYAARFAIADHYFQPAVGASAENNMYLARAQFVLIDNNYIPNALGSSCYSPGRKVTYNDPTLATLLNSCGVTWAFYAEGYKLAKDNPYVCVPYPEGYDPADNPFQYYVGLKDNPLYQKDYADFQADIDAQVLPAVSFVKALGVNTEHPGNSITAGVNFAREVVDAILTSTTYQNNTLVIIAFDESGGYYDHIPTPPTSLVDGIPYGPRVPFLAIGNFAKPGFVSHVEMEHSSLVRFIEWNFLDGEPGQLGTRDAVVNNIGSLLDATKTGIPVP